jgi:hypothetical protein
MYCASCKVRTEFINVTWKKVDRLSRPSSRPTIFFLVVPGIEPGGRGHKQDLRVNQWVQTKFLRKFTLSENETDETKLSEPKYYLGVGSGDENSVGACKQGICRCDCIVPQYRLQHGLNEYNKLLLCLSRTPQEVRRRMKIKTHALKKQEIVWSHTFPSFCLASNGLEFHHWYWLY